MPPDPIVLHVHWQHVTITIIHIVAKIFKEQLQERRYVWGAFACHKSYTRLRPGIGQNTSCTVGGFAWHLEAAFLQEVFMLTHITASIYLRYLWSHQHHSLVPRLMVRFLSLAVHMWGGLGMRLYLSVTHHRRWWNGRCWHNRPRCSCTVWEKPQWT